MSTAYGKRLRFPLQFSFPHKWVVENDHGLDWLIVGRCSSRFISFFFNFRPKKRLPEARQVRRRERSFDKPLRSGKKVRYKYIPIASRGLNGLSRVPNPAKLKGETSESEAVETFFAKKAANLNARLGFNICRDFWHRLRD